jgi:hypothetical protein
MPMNDGVHFKSQVGSGLLEDVGGMVSSLGGKVDDWEVDSKSARRNRRKLKNALDDKIAEVKDSNLPDGEKDDLLTELKNEKQALGGNGLLSSPVDVEQYEQAVDAFKKAKSALKGQQSSGASQASSGGGKAHAINSNKSPSSAGGSNDTPPTTEVDGTDVYEGNVEEFKELKSQLDDLESKKESIQNDPNISEGKKEEMIDQLDAAIRQVERGLDMATASAKYDTTGGSTINDADQSAINQAIAQANDTMRDVNLRVDLATRGTERPQHQCPGPSSAGGADSAGSTSGASGSAEAGGTGRAGGASGPDSTGGTGQTSGASDPPSGATDGGSEEIKGLGMSVDEGVQMLQNNPGELFNEIQNSDLKPKEQQMVFQQIQNRLQSIQQMFQTISSMSKSMHQTKMGIIRNM